MSWMRLAAFFVSQRDFILRSGLFRAAATAWMPQMVGSPAGVLFLN